MDTYVLMMLVCIGLVVGVFVDDARKVRRARANNACTCGQWVPVLSKLEKRGQSPRFSVIFYCQQAEVKPPGPGPDVAAVSGRSLPEVFLAVVTGKTAANGRPLGHMLGNSFCIRDGFKHPLHHRIMFGW